VSGHRLPGQEHEVLAPLTCPACGHTFGWTWDAAAQEWELGTQWFVDPVDISDLWSFTCSQACFVARRAQRPRRRRR
jgi:hypothetical protein